MIIFDSLVQISLICGINLQTPLFQVDSAHPCSASHYIYIKQKLLKALQFGGPDLNYSIINIEDNRTKGYEVYFSCHT